MKKQIIIIGLITLFICVELSGCNEETSEEGRAPIINSFTATPAIVTLGNSSVLNWTVIGATSVNINNGIGNVAINGPYTIIPTQNQTYILTASNLYGSSTASVNVYVMEMPSSNPQDGITVSLVQVQGYISIQKVEGSEIVDISNIGISFVADNGAIAGYATYNDIDSDGTVSGGDTISPPAGLTTGVQYTVTMTYYDEVIGTCKFTVTDSGSTTSIIVSMVQTGGYISIQKVEGGEIADISNVGISFVTSYGAIAGYATYNDINNDGAVSGGDTISPPAGLETDVQYTVTMTYYDDVVGTCKFTVI